MIFGHEHYLAIRPSLNGKRRDLTMAPDSAADVRVYRRQAGAWRWLDEYQTARQAGVVAGRIDASKPFHPGFVLEVHLDQLFQVNREDRFGFSRRYEFHERQMQEHAALAERARTEGSTSTLLDEKDLSMLRAAARAWLDDPQWLASGEPQTEADLELCRVLTVLLEQGKLGGGR